MISSAFWRYIRVCIGYPWFQQDKTWERIAKYVNRLETLEIESQAFLSKELELSFFFFFFGHCHKRYELISFRNHKIGCQGNIDFIQKPSTGRDWLEWDSFCLKWNGLRFLKLSLPVGCSSQSCHRMRKTKVHTYSSHLFLLFIHWTLFCQL